MTYTSARALILLANLSSDRSPRTYTHLRRTETRCRRAAEGAVALRCLRVRPSLCTPGRRTRRTSLMQPRSAYHLLILSFSKQSFKNVTLPMAITGRWRITSANSRLCTSIHTVQRRWWIDVVRWWGSFVVLVDDMVSVHRFTLTPQRMRMIVEAFKDTLELGLEKKGQVVVRIHSIVAPIPPSALLSLLLFLLRLSEVSSRRREHHSRTVYVIIFLHTMIGSAWRRQQRVHMSSSLRLYFSCFPTSILR